MVHESSSWFSSILRIFKPSRPKEPKVHKPVKKSSSTGNLKHQASNSKKDAAAAAIAVKKPGKLRSVSSDHRLNLARTKSMMDPREAEKSRAAGGEAIDLLPPLPTTGLEGFTFDPLAQPAPDSTALKTTMKTASDKTSDTPAESTTTTAAAATTTAAITTTNNEAEKTPLDLDFLKTPQESSFLNDILGDIPIGLVSQITDTSEITTKGTPAVETKPKKEDPPSQISVSAKDSSLPIAVDNDVGYLAAVIDEGTKLPDFSAESFPLVSDVVRAGESAPVTAADKTQKKSNESTLGVDELGANVGNASTTENLDPTTSTSEPTTASSELPTIPLSVKASVEESSTTATVVETKDEKNELLDSHKESDVHPVLEVVKDDTPVLKLEDPAEVSTTTSPAFVAPTEKTDNAKEGLTKPADELISTVISSVDADVTLDTLPLDLKVRTEPQVIEHEIIAETSVEDVPESVFEKASLSSTVKELAENVDDDENTKTSITKPAESEKNNNDALKITTTDLENKKETDLTPVAKDSEATAAVAEAPKEEDHSDLLLPTQSTPELGSVGTLETLDRDVADSQQAQSLPSTVFDKADADETMEVSENSLFSVSPTSENATSVDESFDSRGSSFDELHDSKPSTTEIISELEQVPSPMSKSEKVSRSRSKKTRKTSGSKSSKLTNSAADAPSPEIKLLDPQPEVFVYTSYASGTLHVVPQTRRIQQILDTNHIKHTIVELSTDPKAKRNWKWKGNGKNIPCVVRNNEIIADLKTLEELNEKNLVYQKIVVEEIF